MQVLFSQVYIEAGANFPFSHHFQRLLSREITSMVVASRRFAETYGSDFKLTFNISAKRTIQQNEINGPVVFKKAKDVEYTIFLPFEVIVLHADAPRQALCSLLKGVGDVFDLLEIDKAKLLDEQERLIKSICSDPTMLAESSWNESENKTLVRTLFGDFFGPAHQP